MWAKARGGSSPLIRIGGFRLLWHDTGSKLGPTDSDVTYYLLIIPVGAFCLLLLLGLIVAARQRPSRHDRTLEHIEELETDLGMGESNDLNDADRATPAPEQIDAERAHIRHPGDRL